MIPSNETIQKFENNYVDKHGIYSINTNPPDIEETPYKSLLFLFDYLDYTKNITVKKSKYLGDYRGKLVVDDFLKRLPDNAKKWVDHKVKFLCKVTTPIDNYFSIYFVMKNSKTNEDVCTSQFSVSLIPSYCGASLVSSFNSIYNNDNPLTDLLICNVFLGINSEWSADNPSYIRRFGINMVGKDMFCIDNQNSERLTIIKSCGKAFDFGVNPNSSNRISSYLISRGAIPEAQKMSTNAFCIKYGINI